MPKIIEISKKAKIRNLTKTTVFTMFLRVAGIRNQQFLQSKIIKNRACNPNMLFDTSTHIKYQKVRQKWSQSGILNSSKIDTNLHWDAQEPSWVNPGTKWSPNWCQRGLPGFQNVQKWSPKTSKINKFECKPAWNQVWFVSMINCKTSWNQLIVVWISWWVASMIKFKPSWNQLIKVEEPGPQCRPRNVGYIWNR